MQLRDTYSTHQPVLLALEASRPHESILELGAGDYSTLFFLDRTYFPELKELHTLEHDWDWFERIERKAHGDERLRLELFTNIAQKAATLPLSSYDLILIDNAADGDLPSRIDAIEAVLEQKPPCVVIHDLDVPEYRAAVDRSTSFPLTVFDYEKPWTGLVHDPEKMDTEQIEVLRRDLQSVSS